ncbi:uncharacterized protein LOC133523975 isoform X3 [Cydia pomonella]|nr:uncharacterized protein LOC133523975 isoform X3 [Cydia pomonella]XP_061715701.1 uncharacterized protein LOC133523975 isoform X3 [Cydia pomonella]
MESIKKWLQDRGTRKDGIYVHHSPPKLLGAVSAAQLRQLARGGADGGLERAVLAGQGRRLLLEAEPLHLPAHIEALVNKCEALHEAVEKGSLLELQVQLELLDGEYNRKKTVTCLDEAGAGLLHKAVFYDYTDIVEWLVNNYPQLVHQRDSFGRTPLHYAVGRRADAAAALLERAGAARGARDAAGHTPAFYRAQRTALELPEKTAAVPDKSGLVIKRHNIRIWCHDSDLARLQRVVWEGHGSKLLSEVSNQPVVKKFLEAVPYLMNTIRDIHEAVIQNDLEGLMKHSGDPVTPQALSSRDANNMTAMHKAAGLGHVSIMKYIADRYPQGINDVDNDGRTPLHYAAIVRDEQHTYNTLVGLGADESVVDNKNKTPGYYINRPQEIDKNILKTLPDAPRTPSSSYPSSWDWKLLDIEVIAELNKKSRRKMKASNENISSKNNTTTVSETIENKAGAMKNSSTHEFIKDLPDLDDNVKPNHDNGDTNDSKLEDSQIAEETDDVTENHTEHEEKDKPDEEQPEQAQVEESADDVEEDNNVEHETENGKHLNNDEHETENDTNHKQEVKDEKHEEDEQRDEKNEPETHNVEDDDDKTEAKEQLPDVVESHEDVKDKEKAEIEEITHDASEDHEPRDASEDNEPRDASEDHEPHDHEHSEKNEVDETNHANVEEKAENKDEEQDSAVENHEEHNGESQVDENGELTHKNNDIHKNTKDTGNKSEEEVIESPKEGNNNYDHNEDDDDVQVQGDAVSEYSDTNLRSTAELSDMNSAKRGNLTDGRSTQDSLIEGIVNGEAELDSQDASITQRDGSVHGDGLAVDSEIDPEVTDLINNANMEMLAALVLNGEGSRLVGRRSGNSELQAFLDNVSTYMQKINKVHLAAREGNIRELQAALDRRKFAIARDSISPNGATPLHVATVFGKTNIMKYLGGRFPETLSAVDFEGRTALHYAAVLPDNGHYYNLLQQLGANAKDLDDNGRSAEDYYKNPSLLPFSQLIADFGIDEETAKEMLSDKVPEDQVSSRRVLDGPEALETLERCYRLLASARPARTPLSASSNRATPPLVLGRFLKRPVFDALKYRVTKLDHDLFDVIWPAVKKLPDNRNVVQTVEEDFPGGVTAPDYYVYEVFHEFLTPLVKDLHNINVHSDLPLHPPSDFVTHQRPQTKSSSSSSEPLVEFNIDPNDEFVLSGTIECTRNLQGFELPINLKIGKLETIERIVTTILMREDFAKITAQSNPESDQKGGTYYTLNEVLEKPSEISATLASSGLLIALCDREEIDDYSRLHGKHWPYGRGVYISDDKTIAIWINVHDHIRVVTSSPAESPGEIGLPFSKLFTIMAYLHEKMDFVFDYKLGHLSSRPTFLGSGIRFSLIVNFPGLTKDPDNMKHLCAMRGLQYRETLSPDIARISNYQCLSVTESNCFNDFTTAASNLLHLEKDLSMQNSAHIATMLSNIFRRKRSSLSGADTSDYEKL